MRTIAIANQKGGVGKSVTAINMAAILARDYHKRVLLVDADSQHNLTDFFGAGGNEGSNLSAVLTGTAEAYYPEVLSPTQIDRLDVLAGDDGLMFLDIGAIRSQEVKPTALRELFEAIAEDDAYDYIIVDCPPAFNAASSAAFAAVDEVLIPMKLDRFSVAGMTNILHQIQGLHHINPGLRVAGLLLTMTTRETAEREKELRSYSQKMLPVYGQTIRRSDKVDGMTYAGEDLTLFSPRSGAGIDYRRWVAEYVGGKKHGS